MQTYMTEKDYNNYVLAEILAWAHPRTVDTGSCVRMAVNYEWWMTDYELDDSDDDDHPVNPGHHNYDEDDDSDDYAGILLAVALSLLA
jgi:hypothetical protein